MNQWLANCSQLHPEFPLGRQGTSNELAITYSAAVLAGPLTSATQRRWLAFFFLSGLDGVISRNVGAIHFPRKTLMKALPGLRLQPSVNLHLPVALLCNLTHFPPFVVVWVPDEPSTLLLSVKHGCVAAHPEKSFHFLLQRQEKVAKLMTRTFCTHGGNWIQISCMQRQHVSAWITLLPLNIQHNRLWSTPQYYQNILCCCRHGDPGICLFHGCAGDLVALCRGGFSTGARA